MLADRAPITTRSSMCRDRDARAGGRNEPKPGRLGRRRARAYHFGAAVHGSGAVLTRVKGGRVIDPANGRDGIADIWLRDGRIVDAPADSRPDESYDAAGKFVMAGAIDIHSHIAGSNVNTARLLLPELHRRAEARRAQAPLSNADWGTEPGWKSTSTRSPSTACRRLRRLAHCADVRLPLRQPCDAGLPAARPSTWPTAKARCHRADRRFRPQGLPHVDDVGRVLGRLQRRSASSRCWAITTSPSATPWASAATRTCTGPSPTP